MKGNAEVRRNESWTPRPLAISICPYILTTGNFDMSWRCTFETLQWMLRNTLEFSQIQGCNGNDQDDFFFRRADPDLNLYLTLFFAALKGHSLSQSVISWVSIHQISDINQPPQNLLTPTQSFQPWSF